LLCLARDEPTNGETLLILDAHDKSRETAEKPGRDESGRQRQDQKEWLDALLRLLREPIVELRSHCMPAP
jgi:hypothetical protein